MKENNVITGDKSITNTYTKDYDVITSSTKLSLLDKAIIRTILSFQSQGLLCTMSNDTLSKKIGEPVDSIKKTITKLNKSTFFVSESKPKNNTGEWKAGKEMKIDEQKLFNFLSNDEVLPKLNPNPKNKKKVMNEKPEVPQKKLLLIEPTNENKQSIEIYYEDFANINKCYNYINNNISKLRPVDVINNLGEGVKRNDKAYYISEIDKYVRCFDYEKYKEHLNQVEKNKIIIEEIKL